MARIRWTKNQQRELYRDVRVFNAQRTKAIKLNPEIEKYLPEKLDVKALKKSIQTRQELKDLTRNVNRELKFKFETVETSSGIRTKREVEDVRLTAQIANRLKEKMEKQRGQSQPIQGRMGSVYQAQNRPFRTDVENIPSSDWDKFVKAVRAKSSQQFYTWEADQYKENYIEAIWRGLGANEKTLELVEKVKSIPSSKLYNLAMNHNELFIDFVYAEQGEDTNEILNRVLSAWEMYG